MTEGTTVREGWFRFLWRHKWLVIVPAVVATIATFVVSTRMPRRYQSHASIQIVPQRVPTDYVRSTVQSRLDDRLRSITLQILSRTRLERIMVEYQLYAEARRTSLMEEVVQQMRDDIEIQVTPAAAGTEALGFRVGYTSDDPRTAMRVTDRLAQLFIDENIRYRERMAEGTSQFLEAQVEDTKRRILAHENTLAKGASKSRVQVLEYEALQEHYKNLLLKSEEASLAANLERRQIGEQMKPIESARLPEQPIGPSRRAITMTGTLTGFAIGFVLVGAQSVRERRRAAPEGHTA